MIFGLGQVSAAVSGASAEERKLGKAGLLSSLILRLPHLKALLPNTGTWPIKIVNGIWPSSPSPPSTTNLLHSSKALALFACSAVSGDDAAKAAAAAMLCIVLKLASERACSRQATMRFARTRR